APQDAGFEVEAAAAPAGQSDPEDPPAGVADLVGEGATDPCLQPLPQPGVVDAGAPLAADFPGDAPLHVDAGLPEEPVHRLEDGVDPGADGQPGPVVGAAGGGQGGLVVIRAQREAVFAGVVWQSSTAVFHTFTYLYLAYGG